LFQIVLYLSDTVCNSIVDAAECEKNLIPNGICLFISGDKEIRYSGTEFI